MTTVALVPARDRADSIAATVNALDALPEVDRVLVIDDGSSDGTSEVALAAGAQVLRLPSNRGKGGAVLAGVEATPEADIYLLIDADLGDTAQLGGTLLGPVLADEADMTIAVLPSAGSRGGFGLVRNMARRGIQRAAGREMRAPLSGQRAVRASLLRDLPSAQRFGLEVALSIDALRQGARVVEIDLAMDHRHTGRSIAGFRHRAGQGIDIARSLWPRLAGPRTRRLLLVAAVLATMVITFTSSRFVDIPSSPSPGGVHSVVLFGIPHLALGDLGQGSTPNLDRLVDRGALATMTVRTRRARPNTAEAYATLSAGSRVAGIPESADAFPIDASFEGSTARAVAARRTGSVPKGQVVVVGAAREIRAAGTDISSRPGALGDALQKAGLVSAVVGNADLRAADGTEVLARPAAAAVMNTGGSVDLGVVDSSLLRDAPGAPYGIEVDPSRFMAAARQMMDRADVTVLDPGEMDRYSAYAFSATVDQQALLRSAALARTDAILGQVVRALPSDAMLIVAGLTPPGRTWELTPVVSYGAGVEPGHLHSLSTRRPDLVAVTDIPTTILASLGVKSPDGMIGVAFRYRPGTVDEGRLRGSNAVATGRERIYSSMALTFIVVQALTYIFAILALTRTSAPRRSLEFVKLASLTFAAWPLATFVIRMVPVLMEQGGVTHLLTWLIAAAIARAALKVGGHPLAPLSVISTITVVLILVDLSTGAHLQMASILGYSPHTAARFNGIGNTAYAVFAACAVVSAIVYVDRHHRTRESVWVAAGVLGVVAIADGAPWMGSDVGGILSLVPVFTLIVVALSGRKVSWRFVGLAALATGVILAGAIGIDLLRPPDARTHLAKFVVDSTGGGDTFWTTIARKWSTNLRVFQGSIWTWMVPIIATFAIYVLVIAKGWARLLPRGSTLRIGVVGMLGAGVLGWLVNDSGVVITALVFVYIGPILTLLALDSRRGEPELFEPALSQAGRSPTS